MSKEHSESIGNMKWLHDGISHKCMKSNMVEPARSTWSPPMVILVVWHQSWYPKDTIQLQKCNFPLNETLRSGRWLLYKVNFIHKTISLYTESGNYWNYFPLFLSTVLGAFLQNFGLEFGEEVGRAFIQARAVFQHRTVNLYLSNWPLLVSPNLHNQEFAKLCS